MSLKQGDVAVLNGAIVEGVIVEGAMRLTVDEVTSDGHVFGNDQHGNLMQFHATELTNVSALAVAQSEAAQANADNLGSNLPDPNAPIVDATINPLQPDTTAAEPSDQSAPAEGAAPTEAPATI